MNPKTTSWAVVGIGALVTLLGWYLLPGELAAGILGFGLAHVLLGLLDMVRPTVR